MSMSRIAALRCSRFLLLALLAAAVPCWAQEPGLENRPSEADAPLDQARATLEPSDVHARLMFLQSELDQIRFEMGKPELTPLELDIADVAPREVYFQAETLFRKANRLSFEHTREVSEAPPEPARTIAPTDVMVVVEASIDRITHVKRHLGITQSSVQQPPDRSKTPTDVFRAIAATNRQLNLLLDQPFSPAEVYEQLTLAIGYTARLRTQFSGDRIPDTPPFIRGKLPIDVYRKLVDCFGIIQQIAAHSELPMLNFNALEGIDREVTPSDVYDIATLLVSELAYLWSQLEDTAPPRPAYYPGRKFPSHVYQRAGLLERQLAELVALVDSTPDWLARR